MSKVDFGWHMPSFPVDGSSAVTFKQQIDATMEIVKDSLTSVWFDDHFWPWASWQNPDTPYTEIVSTMAYYAGLYSKQKFVSSMYCQSYRSPGVLAKTVANLQWLTGGRVVFGFGAGWMEPEYKAFDYDFPKPAVRIAQMEEALQIIKLLWTETPASFEGKYYRIENAYCNPKPDPIPPIMIGGGGEQLTLRAVAKYADWWNIPGGSLDNYARKLEILRGHCKEIGRDYTEIRKTYNCEAIAVAHSEAEAKRIGEGSPFQNAPMQGTPEQIADRLNQFVKLGVDQFAVRMVDFPRNDGLQMFIEDVMPLVGK